LFSNLTVRENILIAGYLLDSNRKQVAAHADQLMEELDIIQLAKR
jgi:ABC-type Na+ transport system ATPase subunit NatA